MELLEKMLKELHEKSTTRADLKLKTFCQRIQREKEEKLEKLRKKHERGIQHKFCSLKATECIFYRVEKIKTILQRFNYEI